MADQMERHEVHPPTTPTQASTTTIVIGTRESQLAMIQAEHVRQLLVTHYPHLTITLNGMTTTGDRVLDVALSKIGSKSLFTKELEIALSDNTVDLVVHSLKDLPTSLPEGMILGAVLEREDPRDVVVMAPAYRDKRLASLPAGAVIGTSSVRRAAQLRRRFPHLVFQDVRGNLNTRLKKLDAPESPYAALLLAYAGVYRLGWTDRITEILTSDVILHAVGQGALGIECRADDTRILDLLEPLNHTDTRLRCLAERAFMRALEGGCSVPLGVTTHFTTMTTTHGDVSRSLHLVGSVTRVDGSEEIREASSTVIDAACGLDQQICAAEALGTALAQTLLERGARSILDEIRKS